MGIFKSKRYFDELVKEKEDNLEKLRLDFEQTRKGLTVLKRNMVLELNQKGSIRGLIGKMNIIDEGFIVPVDNVKLKDYEMSLAEARGI